MKFKPIEKPKSKNVIDFRGTFLINITEIPAGKKLPGLCVLTDLENNETFENVLIAHSLFTELNEKMANALRIERRDTAKGYALTFGIVEPDATTE